MGAMKMQHALSGKRHGLRDLQENVIAGRLIA